MEAIVRELKSIGLGNYESRAYISLLKSGALTPMQVSKVAKIPGPRTYDVLRKLESMGFVIKEPKKREPKYSAIPVKAALEHYSKELAEDYKNRERLVKKVSAKLAKVVTPAVSTEEFAYFLDQDQITNWAIRVVVKKKVLGIGQLDKPLFRAYPDISKLLSDLKKDGVKCKFLIDATKCDLNILKKAAKYAEIRHWSEAPSDLAFYIIDGNEFLVAMPTSKTGAPYTGYLIKHRGLIKLCEDFFALKFERGIPIEEWIKKRSNK
jgi:sugar-specific transcriptional regulator TrmB